MRLTALLTMLAISSPAMAQDRQYRELELTDGRTLLAEVVSTEATGLLMRVPQGETLISFELLKNMVPITGAQYREQTPVRMWLHAPTVEKELLAIYANVPQLQVITSDSPGDVPPGIVVQLENCGGDFDCMGTALGSEPWMWFVTATEPTDSTDAALIFRGRVSGGALPTRTNAKTTSIENLWTGAHEALSLQAPASIPKSLDIGTEIANPVEKIPNDWTLKRVVRTSFVPLPGYTSLAQGDPKGFAMGLGTTVGGTALIAGALCAGKQRCTDGGKVAEAVGVGVAGFYVLSVTTNQVFGTQTFKQNGGIVMGAAPTRDGFAVQIGGAL